MPKLPFYWIDAFTSRAFGGNSAAVVPLPQWLADEELQRMATQHGLSETAYYVPLADGAYHLRWFTPGREVDLCGHATLAAATVLFSQNGEREEVRFESMSGQLTVRRNEAGRFELNFPSRPPSVLPAGNSTARLLEALGVEKAVWIGQARDFLVVLDSAQAVAALTPDFAQLTDFDAVTVTARGTDCDFVSRHFAPGYAIDEDPVTGSAHCTLTPYWADHLGQSALTARQISARGGELWCTLDGDRVRIAGNAVIYLSGELSF